MMLLNLGCGEVYHRDWVNLDGNPCAPEVRRCDVRKALPFSDHSFDVVYHSHLLEHLDKTSATSFVNECHRVLRPRGTIRIAVPDLEASARFYLDQIDVAARGGDTTGYNWARLELTDQMTRVVTGGDMQPFLHSLSDSQRSIVRARAGSELDSILRMRPHPGLRRFTVGKAFKRLHRELVRLSVWVLSGPALQAAFDEGWFRCSGEVHRMTYDRVSLAQLMGQCGFEGPVVMAAGQSRIPRFADYGLELVDGQPRKPDSLFMEAEKR